MTCRGIFWASLICFTFSAGAVVAEPLITDEEARLPIQIGLKQARAISRGPAIRYEFPEPIQALHPFDFKIEFEPHGRAKIDPAKVRLTYLKNPGIDLTPRLRPYISDKGILFPKAEIPVGEHQIKIEIEDTNGRQTQAMLTLVAAKRE